jgi:hypothetical protein
MVALSNLAKESDSTLQEAQARFRELEQKNHELESIITQL